MSNNPKRSIHHSPFTTHEKSREHLACVETGKEFISLRKMFELADILKTDVSEFFNFK